MGRSSLRRRGSTLSGSEAPSCPRCPRSRRCGLRRRSTMSLGPPSCTESAPEHVDDEETIESRMAIYVYVHLVGWLGCNLLFVVVVVVPGENGLGFAIPIWFYFCFFVTLLLSQPLLFMLCRGEGLDSGVDSSVLVWVACAVDTLCVLV